MRFSNSFAVFYYLSTVQEFCFMILINFCLVNNALTVHSEIKSRSYASKKHHAFGNDKLRHQTLENHSDLLCRVMYPWYLLMNFTDFLSFSFKYKNNNNEGNVHD